MLITREIEIENIPKLDNKSWMITYVFGGNSAAITLDTNKESIISTDHWIAEESDFFSFTTDGDLSSICLSVPNENREIELKVRSNSFGRIFLGHGYPYLAPIMPLRMFDSINKKLFCFNSNVLKTNNISFFTIKMDLSFIFVNEEYSGFVLDNPLSYLSTERQGYIDTDILPDNFEYYVFGEYLKIVSDNRCNELEDCMESVVVELREKIMPIIVNIRSEFRRNLIRASIENLVDYYL